MDTKLFFILITVFACFVFSCNGNSGTDREPEIPTGEILEEEKPDPFDPYENEPVQPPVKYPVLELVITGEDIKSYNVNTREITFVDSKLEVIKSGFGLWAQLDFIIDDKPVFVPPLWIHAPHSSAGAGDLCLHLGPDFVTIYFTMYFNSWEWWPEAERTIKQKEDEETAKKRTKELDFFIQYLTEKDKIVK